MLTDKVYWGSIEITRAWSSLGQLKERRKWKQVVKSLVSGGLQVRSSGLLLQYRRVETGRAGAICSFACAELAPIVIIETWDYPIQNLFTRWSRKRVLTVGTWVKSRSRSASPNMARSELRKRVRAAAVAVHGLYPHL